MKVVDFRWAQGADADIFEGSESPRSNVPLPSSSPLLPPRLFSLLCVLSLSLSLSLNTLFFRLSMDIFSVSRTFLRGWVTSSKVLPDFTVNSFSFLIHIFHTSLVCGAHFVGPGFSGTKALKKKDALIKPDFDSLPVVEETKSKKGFKALVLSFHLRCRAAL